MNYQKKQHSKLLSISLKKNNEKKKMEEKIRRNIDYYNFLVDTIVETCGKNRVKTRDLYVAVEIADEKFGLKHTAQDNSKVIKRLKNYLGDKIIVTPDTEVKAHGKEKPELLTFKEGVELKIQEPTKIIKKKPAKSKARKTPSKGMMKNIFTFYSILMKDGKGGYVPFTTLSEKLGITINKQVIDNWSKSLKRYLSTGITYELMPMPKGRAMSVKVLNVKTEIFLLATRYKMWFGEELETKEIIGDFKPVKLAPRKALETSTDKAGNTKLTKDEEYLIYHIGGLCHKYRGPIEKATVRKHITETLRFDLGDMDFMGIIKKVPEFSIIRTDQERVSLNDEGWEKVQAQYDPKHQERKIYVRVGLAQEKVAEYMGADNVKLSSPISDSDNIYELKINRTRHSLHNLLRLYKTFRGTDMIFGEDDLKGELDREAINSEVAYKKSDTLYQIEEG